MGLPRFFFRIIPLAAVTVTLIIGGAVFYFRQPLVIVVDPSFSMLYGTNRARQKRAALSLRHFRRVMEVQAAENTGPEIAVAAVNAASQNPKAVFFSGLFAAAARRYHEERPEIPAAVLEGRQFSSPRRGNSGNGLTFIRTGLEADLYRAGVCAAFFAKEGGGRVLFYQERPLERTFRAAFEEGLKSQGFSGVPVYLPAESDYASWDTVSCVVVMGPAARFFEENRGIPAVLFSWIDPRVTPENVKVIFDDSPWAMIPGRRELSGVTALREPPAPFEMSLPSELIVPPGRIKEGAAFLEELARQKTFFGTNEENL